MQEIGVFGGTFNPIHWGHLLLAECARSQFNLNKVLFVTSAHPPHRDDAQLDKEARFAMVENAVLGNDNFVASRLELDREGPSYMVETIKLVKEKYGPGSRPNLIIGFDNLLSLHSWQKFEELTSLCRILVAPRQSISDSQWQQAVGALANAQVEVIDFPQVAISSTIIRKRIFDGKSVLYMVPPLVNDLLQTHGYYQDQAQG